MKPITITASSSQRGGKIVADIDFPALAFLNVQTVDKRRLFGLGRGEISVRLPVPIIEPVHWGRVGFVLRVTIDHDRMSGSGVLYEPLYDVDLWPAISTGRPTTKIYKNGRVDFLTWELTSVTLRSGGAAWENLPPAVITPRE